MNIAIFQRYCFVPFVCVTIWCFVCVKWGVTAELLSESIEIEAGELVWKRTENRYIAKDHVVVRYGPITLHADELNLDATRQTLTAEKDVTLEDTHQGILLSSHHLEFDLQRKTGIITQGELTVVHKGITYRFQGARVEKQEGDRYLVERGSFTTCRCKSGKPSWRVTGQEMRVTLGEYAYAKNSAFWIKGVPILYLPFLFFPVKTERESGFLFPAFSISQRKGFELQAPYYWKISETQDATFTPHYAAKWGGGGDVEYRYRLTQNGFGKLQGEAFSQALREEGKTEGLEEFRWRVAAEHQQHFDHGVGWNLKGDIVSDNLYLKDFEISRVDRLRPFTESSLSLYKGEDLYFASLSGSYYDDLSEADSDRNVHKAPELGVQTRRLRILDTPLYWDAGLQVGHFLRGGEAFDDFGIDQEESTQDAGEGNGEFDVGETIREGDRLAFRNTLAAPLSLRNRWNWIPEASFWETLYRVPVGEDRYKSRHLYMLKSTQGTTLYRVFPLSRDSSERLLHLIEPKSYYLYTPKVDQEDLPLFDSLDRIEEKSLIVYSITNRLIRKSEAKTLNLLYLKVAQHYNFLDHERPLSDLLVEFEWHLSPRLKASLDGNYDLYGEGLRVIESSLQWQSLRGDQVEIGHIHSDAFTVSNRTRVEVSDALDTTYERKETERIFGKIEVPVTSFLTARTELDYSLLTDRLEESRYQLKYLSFCRCWEMTAGFHKTLVPDEERFEVLFTLIGIGDIGG